MPHIVEATMRHLLWDWLIGSLGYDVAGEVYIGDDRIDLVAESPDGLYVGYEVKDQSRIDGPSDVVDLINQLNKYARSEYLDRLYYCSQKPGSMSRALNPDNRMWDIQSINEDLDTTNPLQGFTRDNIVSPPDGIGFIQVPWGNRDEKFVGIEQRAGALRTPRTQTPELPHKNEAWVEHHVWKEIRNDDWEQYGGISEGVLPDPDGRNTRRIDVIGFYGSPVPSDILRNQHKDRFDMIGVEAKGAGLGSGSKDDTRKQLLRYIRSETLTKVYIAVPAGDENYAWEVLNATKQTTLDDFHQVNEDSESDTNSELDKVGIMSVDPTGVVEYVKEAGDLEMTYDAFTNADYGPDTVLSVGWGRYIQEQNLDDFESVYDQFGEQDIYRKAKAIDTDCVKKLFSRHEYQNIFQLRQKVLGGGELDEAEEYLFEQAYEKCGNKYTN